jgi:hypothetical protein
VLALLLKAALAHAAPQPERPPTVGPQPMVSPPVPGVPRTTLLLADEDRTPHVRISWPTADGSTVTLEADRPWASPGLQQEMSAQENVASYAGLGGTRLDRGGSHPAGAILRVGFYKVDTSKPFFKNIADGGTITITLSNAGFNQPVTARPRTILQHLKYMKSDIDACGLGVDALDQFNTYNPKDTLNGNITALNMRPGALDGHDPSQGTASATVEDDGTVTMTVAFPYPLLRHIRDPWLRTTPGSFFEPNHFHIECEVVPKPVGDALEAAEKAQQEAERAAEAQRAKADAPADAKAAVEPPKPAR